VFLFSEAAAKNTGHAVMVAEHSSSKLRVII
jgi:hypothetical protein